MVNLRAELRCFYSCSIHKFYTVCSTEMSYVLYSLFYGNVICSIQFVVRNVICSTQFVLRKCHVLYSLFYGNVICSIQFVVQKCHMFHTVCSTECHMFYTVCCMEMSYVLYCLFYGNVICSKKCVLQKCHMFYTVCSTEMLYILYMVNLSDKAISLINNLISALHSDYLPDVPPGALYTGGVFPHVVSHMRSIPSRGKSHEEYSLTW